jgi:hypothetical protein
VDRDDLANPRASQLYTKAYEVFKRFKSTRMTLYLAAQIALVHLETGKHDMALKCAYSTFIFSDYY